MADADVAEAVDDAESRKVAVRGDEVVADFR
jgi:hypothetical protein